LSLWNESELAAYTPAAFLLASNSVTAEKKNQKQFGETN
jgi:hypothetical protein